MTCRWIAGVAYVFGVLLAASHTTNADEYLSGIKWDEPPVVTPGKTCNDPPSDAKILFDGTDFSQWVGAEHWTIEGEAMVAGKGDIRTKESFGDCQLHIEFATPKKVVGKGQGRGNSGVFLMDRYELQVLDSYQNETYFDGMCGAIYKQHPPLVNASRPPGEWQTYDIYWTAPRFKDGELEKPATITVFHNGVLIQDHFELLGDTPFNRPPRYQPHPPKGPIRLQWHGNPVRFRNIWIREVKELGHKRVSEPRIVKH